MLAKGLASTNIYRKISVYVSKILSAESSPGSIVADIQLFLKDIRTDELLVLITTPLRDRT